MEEKAGPQLAWARAIRKALPEDGYFVDEFTQVGYVARVTVSRIQTTYDDYAWLPGNTWLWLCYGAWCESSAS